MDAAGLHGERLLGPDTGIAGAAEYRPAADGLSTRARISASGKWWARQGSNL
jgi:hypothetical protein